MTKSRETKECEVAGSNKEDTKCAINTECAAEQSIKNISGARKNSGDFTLLKSAVMEIVDTLDASQLYQKHLISCKQEDAGCIILPNIAVTEVTRKRRKKAEYKSTMTSEDNKNMIVADEETKLSTMFEETKISAMFEEESKIY